MTLRTFHSSRPDRAAGFSLIELVMVLVIMSIMTAIAVPRYAQAASHYRAEMAARRIAADLGMAQARARVQSSSQSVRFDTATQYTLPTLTDPDQPAATYTVDLTQQTYRATLALNLTGAKTAVAFNGYGIPDCGGTITVSSGGATKVVSVNAETGTVQIQ